MKIEAQRIQEVQELIAYCEAQIKEIEAIPEIDRDNNDDEWREIYAYRISDFEELIANPAKLVKWSEEKEWSEENEDFQEKAKSGGGGLDFLLPDQTQKEILL